MKTVLTALTLALTVVACGKKKTEEVPLGSTTAVVEPAKVEGAVTPASAVVTDPSMSTGGAMKQGEGATITTVPAATTTEVK